MERAILIMAKRPTAGSSKTRLMPVLSPEDAAELSRCFIVDAVAGMRDLASRSPATTVSIAGAPAASADYFRSLAPDVGFVAQRGDSLGQRLHHVMSTALTDGAEMVVAINSDSPTLPPMFVEHALDQLAAEGVDVVLGPAKDGGYWLIGWKRPHQQLVEGVQMSTPTVLADTLAIAGAEGLRVVLVEPWYDVDVPEDLDRVRAALDRGEFCGPATAGFFADRQCFGRPQPNRSELSADSAR